MDTTYLKDPSAILDYILDWGSWLRSGETISTSSWGITLEGGGATGTGDLALVQGAILGTAAVAWLTAGVEYISYTVTNTITTSGGRTDSRNFTVTVQPR